MLRGGHCLTLCIINGSERSHTCCPLSVIGCGSKGKRHLHSFCDLPPVYRHAVSQKDHFTSQAVQFVHQFVHRRCALILNTLHHKLLFTTSSLCFCLTKFIDPGVYLIPSGIHNGADQLVRPPEIKCKSFQCRHLYQRQIQCQTKSLRGCCTNSQSGKGSGTCGDSNGINGVKIQVDHLPDLVQHRK